jgi:hypothetical protein
MKLKLLLFFVLMPHCVHAIGFNNYYHIMRPSTNKITIEALANPTSSKRAHFYAAKVQQIKNPYDLSPVDAEKNQLQNLVFTPSRSVALPGKDVPFTFIYNGPKDDKERYYAITWSDYLVSSVKQHDENNTGGSVSSSVTATTVLVVAPRKINYLYELKDGELSNLGNATLDLFGEGQCVQGDEDSCHIARPLLPGEKLSIAKSLDTDKPFTMAFWAEQNRIIYIQ